MQSHVASDLMKMLTMSLTKISIVRCNISEQVHQIVHRALHGERPLPLGRQIIEIRQTVHPGGITGHAVERTERYQWRHGAAIAVGMMFVAELARLAGRCSDALVDRHRDVLTAVGLPVTYRGDRWPQLLEAMAIDKKARGSLLRFIVLEDIARPALLEGPDPALLLAAYGEVSR